MIARLVKYRVTVALVLGVAAIAISIYGIGRRAADNARAAKALCALRDSLKHRGDQGIAFLRENPHGSGGISRAVIVKSIRDTRGTLHALRILDCG